MGYFSDIYRPLPNKNTFESMTVQVHPYFKNESVIQQYNRIRHLVIYGGENNICQGASQKNLLLYYLIISERKKLGDQHLVAKSWLQSGFDIAKIYMLDSVINFKMADMQLQEPACQLAGKQCYAVGQDRLAQVSNTLCHHAHRLPLREMIHQISYNIK